jgi:hypothetical protein
MIIVFGESSVIVDLQYSDLLAPAMACGFSLAVVDLLFNQMSLDDGVSWQASGIVVLNLSGTEVEWAQTLRSENTGLAFSECFALSRAARPQHTLVTDNQTLREVAKANGVPAEGFSWLLEQMAHSGRVAAGVLRAGMTTLAKMGRRQMSQEDIEQQYQSWNTSLAVA